MRIRFLIPFVASLTVLALARGLPLAADPAMTGAQAFVQELGTKAVDILDREGLAPDQRVEAMRSLFNDYFDVPGISQWVLGRHWRRATDEQIKAYRELFEDFIVYGYARRFGAYAGERLQINRAIAEADGMTLVHSEVARPGGQGAVQVEWRVEQQGGVLKIRDVVVEGVSMAQTQRSDFAAAIQQKGGSIDGLLDTLRQKIAELKAEVEKSG